MTAGSIDGGASEVVPVSSGTSPPSSKLVCSTVARASAFGLKSSELEIAPSSTESELATTPSSSVDAPRPSASGPSGASPPSGGSASGLDSKHSVRSGGPLPGASGGFSPGGDAAQARSSSGRGERSCRTSVAASSVSPSAGIGAGSTDGPESVSSAWTTAGRVSAGGISPGSVSSSSAPGAPTGPPSMRGLAASFADSPASTASASPASEPAEFPGELPSSVRVGSTASGRSSGAASEPTECSDSPSVSSSLPPASRPASVPAPSGLEVAGSGAPAASH